MQQPFYVGRFGVAAAIGLRHPASASCLGRHLRFAGRCPNNSSLFPPLAAVVVVALWPYSAERLFIISRLSHSAECDKRYFHRRGRGGKRQLPRLFPRGNSHAAGALRHESQHDPLSHRCAMPDFPLSSLRASSPRSGWKSFLKGRAKSTAESLLMMPNTLATGFKPWLPPSGKLARERLRGRARLAGAAPHPALRATFPRWVKA